jgi:hypothetical protein
VRVIAKSKKPVKRWGGAKMETSATIGKLADALAKAQGVMNGATKDSANPFFNSKYADLSSVWDACRKPLSDNGLSIVQVGEFLPEHPDLVCVVTTLCHSSGEWIRGMFAVRPGKTDPQAAGSAITYLRRYSLQSMVGIAPEDDDGNAASAQPGANTPAQKQRATPPKTTAPPKSDKKKPESTEALICMAAVKDISHKDGETNGKKWRRYGVQDDNENWYSTFSETLVDIANSAKTSGEVVALHYTEKDGPKGPMRNLTDIELISQTA